MATAAIIDVTNKQILEEIQRNRTELKNVIKESEARLLLIIESLSNKINTLEKENLNLKDKIELLERNQKQNNIVIFGLNKKSDEVTVENICQEIKTRLDINLTEADVNNIYSLGKSENSPVKIELVSLLKKKNILKNCHRLKGSNISVTQDLTLKQRQENKILRRHLRKSRENKQYRSYIKGDRLYINNVPYTSRELEKLEDIPENITGIEENNTPRTLSQGLVNTSTYIGTKETLENIQTPNTLGTGTVKKQLKQNNITNKTRTRSHKLM